MHLRSILCSAFALALPLFGSLAARAAIELDFDTVASLSARGVDVVLAERAVDEARAGVTGAEALLSENPTLDAVGGPRLTSEGLLPEAGADLSVPLELYGTRALRIDAASHEVTAREAVVIDARRRAAGEALARYLEALHAREVRALAEARAAVAAELLKATAQKRKAGDVGDLDLSLIALEDARARSAVVAAASEEERAIARLRLSLLLQSTEEVVIREDLQTSVARFRAAPPRQTVERPDVAAAARAADAARAGLTAEERAAWPVTSLALGYAHEEGENVGLIGLSIPIGFFQTNQGGIAAAKARIGARDAERLIVERRAEVETLAAARRLVAARTALEILEAGASPRIDEGVELSRRAYTLGERDLTDVLVVQRETLDAKLDVQAARLELGLAGVEELVAAGALR